MYYPIFWHYFSSAHFFKVFYMKIWSSEFFKQEFLCTSCQAFHRLTNAQVLASFCHSPFPPSPYPSTLYFINSEITGYLSRNAVFVVQAFAHAWLPSAIFLSFSLNDLLPVKPHLPLSEKFKCFFSYVSMEVFINFNYSQSPVALHQFVSPKTVLKLTWNSSGHTRKIFNRYWLYLAQHLDQYLTGHWDSVIIFYSKWKQFCYFFRLWLQRICTSYLL